MIKILISIMRWVTYYILGKNYLEALQNMTRGGEQIQLLQQIQLLLVLSLLTS